MHDDHQRAILFSTARPQASTDGMLLPPGRVPQPATAPHNALPTEASSNQAAPIQNEALPCAPTCCHLTGSSPPSPELDLPPMRFMAMAMVSWVSRLMAPSDMPPVQKRDMMLAAGSTSSIEMGWRLEESSRQSRSTATGACVRRDGGRPGESQGHKNRAVAAASEVEQEGAGCYFVAQSSVVRQRRSCSQAAAVPQRCSSYQQRGPAGNDDSHNSSSSGGSRQRWCSPP
jgi:hypothetical protein